MSFEHAIPRFLGGAHLPDTYKTHRVCRTCNNNLGLFVDASFERSWIVTNWLQQSAIATFDPQNPTSLPLVCLGKSEHSLPGMQEGEICEVYIGPLGEVVYWIRPDDEKLFWYSGGNPIATKQIASRAYFFFSTRSHKNVSVTWASFQEAFKKENIRKVFGTQITGADPSDIGFSTPDSLDVQRIDYLLPFVMAGNAKVGLSFDVNYDFRFLAKLARGVGFCLFGEKVLQGGYATEIKKALWHRTDETLPQLRGRGTFGGMENQQYPEHVGHIHAVTCLIISVGKDIVININMGTKLSAFVVCADYEMLGEETFSKFGRGQALILFPHLKKALTLSILEYMSHKAGRPSLELSSIETAIDQNVGYFKNL